MLSVRWGAGLPAPGIPRIKKFTRPSFSPFNLLVLMVEKGKRLRFLAALAFAFSGFSSFGMDFFGSKTGFSDSEISTFPISFVSSADKDSIELAVKGIFNSFILREKEIPGREIILELIARIKNTPIP